MEMTSFSELFFNPVAQVKFIHTVAAGYVTGAMFVLSISAYYLLRKRDVPFARRSFAVAAGFGLASICSVIILGDESGYEVGDVQKAKLAAIEAEWHTEEPPAAFTLFGFPNDETMETEYAIKIPYVMGIIATRSLDTPVMGIKELIEENEQRVRSGMEAYDLLVQLRNGSLNPVIKHEFEQVKGDLGYGLLLKKYTDNVTDATEEQIKAAARDSVPKVAPLFWTFRIMVACGFTMLIIFAMSFYYCAKREEYKHKWLLRVAMFALPLPWIAAETGWFVAEYGRQPWTISGILPTHLSTSSISVESVYGSLIAIVVFYTLLMIIEVYLMLRFVRLGPSSLHTGRYHFESKTS
jgi:cytochrome d ubiquinol oxidase subunit I